MTRVSVTTRPEGPRWRDMCVRDMTAHRLICTSVRRPCLPGSHKSTTEFVNSEMQYELCLRPFVAASADGPGRVSGPGCRTQRVPGRDRPSPTSLRVSSMFPFRKRVGGNLPREVVLHLIRSPLVGLGPVPRRGHEVRPSFEEGVPSYVAFVPGVFLQFLGSKGPRLVVH